MKLFFSIVFIIAVSVSLIGINILNRPKRNNLTLAR